MDEMHAHARKLLTLTTQSIIDKKPPNSTDITINLLMMRSYGYSVVVAILMVIERGHCGRTKSVPGGYVDSDRAKCSWTLEY